MNVTAGSNELADLLGLKASRIKVILSEMVADKIIVAEGDFKNRVYRLKEKASEQSVDSLVPDTLIVQERTIPAGQRHPLMYNPKG